MRILGLFRRRPAPITIPPPPPPVKVEEYRDEFGFSGPSGGGVYTRC